MGLRIVDFFAELESIRFSIGFDHQICFTPIDVVTKAQVGHLFSSFEEYLSCLLTKMIFLITEKESSITLIEENNMMSPLVETFV